MTPADRRITELIDKWLASIDLHLQYVELSDAAYARAQDWPKHDRPTRWVLEVARQKALELKAHCETRQAMGDSRFSESLELMSFLSNLVGIQHIQRFVPLADPSRTDTGATAASRTVEGPAVVRAPAPRTRPSGGETTREMPHLKPPATSKPAAAPKPSTPGPAATQRPAQRTAAQALPRGDGATGPMRPAAAPAQPRAPARSGPPTRPLASKAAAPARVVSAAEVKDKIIADAIRLLKWGKSWHELGELIERIADRPPAAEIRKVLRAHRAEIEARAK